MSAVVNMYHNVNYFHIISVYQVIFIASAMFGAYISSTLSGRYGTIWGKSIPEAFIGGVMIVFGSRMAGGCTR